MRPLENYRDTFRPGCCLIEADAGTGKTFTIVDAVVWLVALGYYRLNDFLLITFTRAATEEMRDRLRSRLDKVLQALEQGLADSDDRLLRQLREYDVKLVRQRLEGVRLEAIQATVCTIHSFCQQVLQRWPQLCGFGQRRLEPEIDWVLEEMVDDFLLAGHADAETPAESRGELIKVLRLAVRHFRAEVSEQHRNGALGRFVQWGRAELRRRLERYGLVSYDELVLKVREVLELPDVGNELARQLRERYRAVMVDEFQDTDLEQWEIIRRVWLDPGADKKNETFLCLVGDPKQSIYAFRSADVFVFAEAKRLIPADRQFTLSLNHRSDGRLVEALNLLWLRGGKEEREVFDLPDFISMREALWPKEKKKRFCRLVDSNGRPGSAIEIKWLGDLSLNGQRVTLSNKEDLEKLIPQLVAVDVVRLLQGGYRLQDGEANDAWRPLDPGDIAVLVQTNERARSIARQLRRLRVPVSLGGSGSVLESEAASWLMLLLQAMEQPFSYSRLRALAACGWFALSADEIVKAEDNQKLSQHLERLQADVLAWSQVLERQGPMALVQKLLESEWLKRAGFFRRTDTSRLLADTRHLAELLCLDQTAGSADAAQLVRKLTCWRQTAPRDSEQFLLRLEESGGMVRVLTIHRSKGLQFPVVFLPDLWLGKKEPDLPLTCHRRADDGSWKLELLLDEGVDKRLLQQARREALQERMRLLYVGLTRARHHLAVYYAPAGTEKTRSPAGIILCRRPAEGIDSTMKFLAGNADEISRRIDEWCDGEVVRRVKVSEVESLCYQRPRRRQKAVVTAFDREFDAAWGGYSFSSLVRKKTPVGATEEEVDEIISPEETAESIDAQRLPAGRLWGDLVHRVLERLDLSTLKGVRHPPPELEKIILQQLNRSRVFSQEAGDRLMRDVLRWANTPLGGELGGFCLADLGPADRLVETLFLLPLERVLDSEDLMRLVAEAIESAPPADYPSWVEQLRQLQRGKLAGLLNGKIDLVFRLQKDGVRYYLLDYKTNYLGEGAYGRQQLLAAMADKHYFLQLVLYCLALHRYLKLRMPGYRFEKNFGGAIYLFLRGFEADSGGELSAGVLLERPKEGALEKLDECLYRGGRR